MDSEALSIGELADAVGLTRRAIRFYVQQKLLPPPLGRGRGHHYDAGHLARLRRVIALQQAGHSLEAIRRLLANEPARNGSAQRAHGLNGSSRDSLPATSEQAPPARSRSDESPEAGARRPGPAGSAKPQAAGLSARLWTRLTLGEGIELSYDAMTFNPTVEQLLTIRQAVREILLEHE